MRDKNKPHRSLPGIVMRRIDVPSIEVVFLRATEVPNFVKSLKVDPSSLSSSPAPEMLLPLSHVYSSPPLESQQSIFYLPPSISLSITADSTPLPSDIPPPSAPAGATITASNPTSTNISNALVINTNLVNTASNINTPGTPSTPLLSTPSSPPSAHEGGDGDEADGTSISTLQRTVIHALQYYGGSTSLNNIHQFVGKRWYRIKKKDGIKYANDYKRSVTHVLSAPATLGALFDRVVGKDGHWALGPKAKIDEDDAAKLDDEMMEDKAVDFPVKSEGVDQMEHVKDEPELEPEPDPEPEDDDAAYGVRGKKRRNVGAGSLIESKKKKISKDEIIEDESLSPPSALDLASVSSPASAAPNTSPPSPSPSASANSASTTLSGRRRTTRGAPSPVPSTAPTVPALPPAPSSVPASPSLSSTSLGVGDTPITNREQRKLAELAARIQQKEDEEERRRKKASRRERASSPAPSAAHSHPHTHALSDTKLNPESNIKEEDAENEHDAAAEDAGAPSSTPTPAPSMPAPSSPIPPSALTSPTPAPAISTSTNPNATATAVAVPKRRGRPPRKKPPMTPPPSTSPTPSAPTHSGKTQTKEEGAEEGSQSADGAHEDDEESAANGHGEHIGAKKNTGRGGGDGLIQLQVIIAMAIKKEGGAADLNDIYQIVKKFVRNYRWGTLGDRTGFVSKGSAGASEDPIFPMSSLYTTIEGILTSGDGTMGFVTFRRDAKKDDLWTVSSKRIPPGQYKVLDASPGSSPSSSPPSSPSHSPPSRAPQQVVTKILSSTRMVTSSLPSPSLHSLPGRARKERTSTRQKNSLTASTWPSPSQSAVSSPHTITPSYTSTSPPESPSLSTPVGTPNLPNFGGTTTPPSTPPTPLPDANHVTSTTASSNNNSGSSSGTETPGRGSSTTPNMQDMLMNILLQAGGAAPFEKIYAAVEKNWLSLKKGNGASDCRRAILASLSHNPPGNFRKDVRKEGWWTISPRAVPWAKRLIKDNKTSAVLSLRKMAEEGDGSELE